MLFRLIKAASGVSLPLAAPRRQLCISPHIKKLITTRVGLAKNMFRKAVDAHTSALPSEVDRALEKEPSYSSGSGLFSKNALRPTSSSVVDGYVNKPYAPVHGAKRSANGLIKAVGGSSEQSFEDRSSANASQTITIELEADSQAKENCETIVINEDDFDSDIELEISQPSTNTVTYPRLPSQQQQLSQPPPNQLVPSSLKVARTETSVQKFLSFPTQSRAQVSGKSLYPSLEKAKLHSEANSDRPFGSQGNKENKSPSGSIPIPWSSSPLEHLTTPLQGNSLHNPAYFEENLANILNAGRDAKTTQVASEDEPIARPPKRRTLPWLDEEANAKADEAKRPVPKTPKASATHQQNESTPSNSSTSLYPWNTTASAMKQQQKEHKKATKKNSKTEDTSAVDKNVSSVTISKTKSVSRLHLSKEQRHVLDLAVEKGKSIFFTGSAGTGKSVLLREIIAVLRRKYQKETDRVAITASTGLAACNIGGVTLHSFSGIGLGKQEVPELVKRIKRNQKAKHRWMRTKVLVIDEVSMVDGELFDKLEEVARSIRGNSRPFGGIQLVITGDFFQLPPVPDSGSGRVAKFSFDAKTWNSVIDHTIGLHHVFRQKDPVFAGMLNEMREGRLSPRSVDAFRGLSRPIHYEDSLSATELFPTRAEVDAANNSRMRQLGGGTQVYQAVDGGVIEDKVTRDKLLQNCMAPQTLELKKGSQVMLIKNMDESLVNGSLGKVIGFMNEELFNSYHDYRDDFIAAQATEDYKQLTPDQLKLKKQMDAARLNTAQNWPMVRFTNPDGTTRDLLCTRESWTIELPNGEIQASRKQIPLILAWALSIHKAQGQTLERVKVDLGKVFEKGQAYVALSRATSMAGLQVLRFDPSKVVAHERVRSFYASLSRLENKSNARGENAQQEEQDDLYM